MLNVPEAIEKTFNIQHSTLNVEVARLGRTVDIGGCPNLQLWMPTKTATPALFGFWISDFFRISCLRISDFNRRFILHSPFFILPVKLIYLPFYWSFRMSSGLWYWLGRRFTPAGLCVAGGWFLAGAVGVDIENTVTYQSFALLFGFLVFAFISSFFFRARFVTIRTLPRFGTAGQPLHYQVQVKNLTRVPQVGLTLLDDLEDPRPPFAEWLAFHLAESRRIRPFSVFQRRERSPFRLASVKASPIPPMPPKGEATATVQVLPLRRGILRFRGLTVACPDALGLFRSFCRFASPQTILILPKRYPLPPIDLPGAMRYQEGGVALASNIGRSEEFVALREYRHGDPLRHIHWRSWAKTGKPIVKEFEDEFFVRHALILDTFSEEPHSEILEESVSIAASFACTVLTQESLLDLLFIGNQSYCITAGRGLGTADQMLEILASVRNCADKPFESLEHLVFGHISMVSGCICIFQKWDDTRRKFIARLRAINVPILVLIVVRPGEKNNPPPGLQVDAEGSRYILEAGKIAEGLAKLK